MPSTRSGVGMLTLRESMHPRPSPLAPRHAMTLVELLVVILIIAILTALVLGVASVAGQSAREARTRTMISRLHTLLMEQYDSYKNRRIDTSAIEFLTATNPTPDQRADNRLLALRQLMKMELPDRWSDLLNDTVDNLPPNAKSEDFEKLKNNVWITPVTFLFPPNRSELWAAYIRRYRQIGQRRNALTGGVNTPNIVRANQGAECLYMIITIATGDGEARSLFTEKDIGDTDGDGAPEFLDGWGRPIGFIRWAPGFNSDLQLSPIRLRQIRDDAEAEQVGTGALAMDAALAADHDPFDIYRRDATGTSSGSTDVVYAHLRAAPSAFRLVPLIYSGGRNEDADITEDPTALTTLDPYDVTPNGYLLGFPVILPQSDDPTTYARRMQELDDYTDNTNLNLEVDDDGDQWVDNIHNHLIGTR